MYVCTTCVCLVPTQAKMGNKSDRGCEPLCAWLEPHPDPLQEQQVVLTVEELSSPINQGSVNDLQYPILRSDFWYLSIQRDSYLNYLTIKIWISADIKSLQKTEQLNLGVSSPSQNKGKEGETQGG